MSVPLFTPDDVNRRLACGRKSDAPANGARAGLSVISGPGLGGAEESRCGERLLCASVATAPAAADVVILIVTVVVVVAGAPTKSTALPASLRSLALSTMGESAGAACATDSGGRVLQRWGPRLEGLVSDGEGRRGLGAEMVRVSRAESVVRAVRGRRELLDPIPVKTVRDQLLAGTSTTAVE